MKYTLTREPITEGAIIIPEIVRGNGIVLDYGQIRVFMLLSDFDRGAFDSLSHRSRKKVLVKDLITGGHVYIKRSSCGLGCYCGASIVEEA